MTITAIANVTDVTVHVVRMYCLHFFEVPVNDIKDEYSIGVSNKIIDVIRKWKTGAEVCKELGISRQWLYDLRKTTDLPCKNFGKKTYYEVEAVKKYVKKLSK